MRWHQYLSNRKLFPETQHLYAQQMVTELSRYMGSCEKKEGYETLTVAAPDIIFAPQSLNSSQMQSVLGLVAKAARSILNDESYTVEVSASPKDNPALTLSTAPWQRLKSLFVPSPDTYSRWNVTIHFRSLCPSLPLRVNVIQEYGGTIREALGDLYRQSREASHSP